MHVYSDDYHPFSCCVYRSYHNPSQRCAWPPTYFHNPEEAYAGSPHPYRFQFPIPDSQTGQCIGGYFPCQSWNTAFQNPPGHFSPTEGCAAPFRSGAWSPWQWRSEAVSAALPHIPQRTWPPVWIKRSPCDPAVPGPVLIRSGTGPHPGQGSHRCWDCSPAAVSRSC